MGQELEDTRERGEESGGERGAKEEKDAEKENQYVNNNVENQEDTCDSNLMPFIFYPHSFLSPSIC